MALSSMTRPNSQWFLRKMLPSGLRVCLLVALLPSTSSAAGQDFANAPVPLSYFGLVMNRATPGKLWPAVPFGSWRLWDTYSTWPNLEKRPGQWQFEALDRMVADAIEHKVAVLMPLAHSPRWAAARPDEKGAYGPGSVSEPAVMGDWRNYVRTLAIRYKGRVHEYEVWNEPSDRSHFSGSVEKLVELTCEAYKVLKAVDPAIQVVSPASAGEGGHIKYLDRFLAAGGAKCIDVVAHHFYVPRFGPEAMVQVIREVRAVMTKNGVGNLPLWNTETGWWLENTDGVTDPDYVAKGGWRKLTSGVELEAVITRALLLARAEGIDRFYWYAWSDGVFGLADAAGVAKHGVDGWARVVDQMLGSRVLRCEVQLPDKFCEMQDSAGVRRKLSWHDPDALQRREGPAFDRPASSTIPR